jgi:hypothetical protein
MVIRRKDMTEEIRVLKPSGYDDGKLQEGEVVYPTAWSYASEIARDKGLNSREKRALYNVLKQFSGDHINHSLAATEAAKLFPAKCGKTR